MKPNNTRNPIGAGRGNKADEGTKVIKTGVTFVPPTLDRLDRYAAAIGENRSAALDRVIHAGLDALGQ